MNFRYYIIMMVLIVIEINVNQKFKNNVDVMCVK